MYEKRREFAIIDCSCAGENILPAAEALGRGAVRTAAYLYKNRMDVVRKTLNILICECDPCHRRGG